MGRISQRDKAKLLVSNAKATNETNGSTISIFSRNNENENNAEFITDFSNMNLWNYEEEKQFLPLNIFYIDQIKNGHYIYYQTNQDFKLFDINYINGQKKAVESSIFEFNFKDIIPRNSFTNELLNKEFENLLVSITVLRNKVYFLYTQLMKPFEGDIDRANYLVKNNITVFDGHDATKEQFFMNFMGTIEMNIKGYLTFVYQLPGFNKICLEDFYKIHRQNYFVFRFFFGNKFVINNECYAMFGSIQFSRKWIYEFLGTKMGNYIFYVQKKITDLNLTNYETALIFPYVLLSVNGKFVQCSL